jgi:hypothetical protein
MFKNAARLLLSLAVSFAILALLLQLVNSGVSDLERPSILASLQNTEPTFLFIYVVMGLLTLALRAHRYRLLIAISGEANVPTFKQMLIVTGVRNMVVDMLPARLGELGYVGILNRGYGVKLEHAISSLSISIAFDFIAVVMVIFIIVCSQLAGGELQTWAIGAMIMAIIIASIAVAGLFLIVPWVNGMLAKYFPAQNADSLWAKLLQLSDDFSGSLQTARAAGKSLSILLLSMLIRGLKYTGLYLLFQAVVAPSFAELAALPFEHIVGALIGGEIGASLPIPTFMSFGAYEAGGALIFQLLGVVNQSAVVVTMLCVHIWSQIFDYVLGGICLIIFIAVLRNRPLMNTSSKITGNTTIRAESKEPLSTKWGKPLMLIAGVISLLLAGYFLANQVWKASKLGSLSAPAAGATADNVDQWQALSAAYTNNIKGFVVFSSNRDGNHDIFKLDLKSSELSKLSNHPHAETYPRISPDGLNLVFSRAHQPWVSQRNTDAWDVYLLNLTTLEERKIAENATAPAWTSAQSISFVQASSKVVYFDLSANSSKVVYETGVNTPMPKGSKIQNPKYNPLTEEVSFTGRQSDIKMNKGHWGTAIASDGKVRGIHNGCELSWGHGFKRLFQVHSKTGFNGSNRIVSVNSANLELQTLIDLKGEFSHEYWPQESSNGQYMVFGASRSSKEHEHDVADYEIFLWKVGSQAHEATRLTFHTGNDNWPDVFVED